MSMAIGAGLCRMPMPASVAAMRDEAGAWEVWMVAAQAGDGAAYTAVLRACVPYLRGVARRRLREPSSIEDAVQDTLLSIHRLRHTWDPERPLRPWLAAIADRRAIDVARREGRRQGREVDLAPLAETLASAGEDGEAASAAHQLRVAISELPESQRTALRLAKLENLPLAEAAARSGLSVGALKVATHRAMASLRKRLGASPGGGRDGD
ncbi:RNA polymerase ECF family sigma subunit [Humitalea rosea]|uniref:RNA polymerase ECF family sigma subunit n=1 Tax=Humitalea rosea TaxID=990373 RepID=A0A2W7INK9_9PROT|nr:sigma-70 family RNA polymerase sigma factor [Humitalea rosea]PZW49089.1 RNA polymerase ECF family sigma subunit [Humitalea rosea]